MNTSRRDFTKTAIAAASLMGLPAWANARVGYEAGKMKFVCVGGHPDDPESGCGGTLAKLAAAGHDVAIIYLTRGEAGIDGKSHSDAAAIRTREAEEACKIIGAKALFAGQTDGDTIVNSEWIQKMQQMIAHEKPSVVFTHWPIDSHKDHQAASLLTMQAWLRTGKPFELYFFEVCTGSQTMGFKPTDYVDITTVQEQKRKAVYCHVSQNPPGIYAASDCNHGMMEKFRGIEYNVPAAEGFVRVAESVKHW